MRPASIPFQRYLYCQDYYMFYYLKSVETVDARAGFDPPTFESEIQVGASELLAQMRNDVLEVA